MFCADILQTLLNTRQFCTNILLMLLEEHLFITMREPCQNVLRMFPVSWDDGAVLVNAWPI